MEVITMENLKDKSEAELQELLRQERAKLRELRFQVLSEQYKQVRDVRVVRKNIARILTELNSRRNKK